MRTRIIGLGLVATLVVGCGDSESESSSSFTSCETTLNDCVAGICTVREECDVDECESELDYDFDGEEYESKCTFGDTLTTTTFPAAGGAGTREIHRDVDECFYQAEIDYDDGDFEEERRCTRVRDCTLETLACDDPESFDDLDCEVVDSEPCSVGDLATATHPET